MTKINILCPCAGLGTRVRDKYGIIKPLIEVNNKTLIEWVIQNVYCKDAHYIFVVQREHCRTYELDLKLTQYCDKLGCSSSVIQIDGLTSGAAVTCMKAESYVNNEVPLLISNSDQYALHFSTHNFFKQMEIDNADASALVFEDSNPKWSFVKLNKQGVACQVVEKSPISHWATLGYYGFINGALFCDMAKKMLTDDFRVNNEHFVSPTLDYAIRNGYTVKAYYSDKCYGTGVPEDIENFRTISKDWV